MDQNGDLILDIRNKWLKNPRCQEPFQNKNELIQARPYLHSPNKIRNRVASVFASIGKLLMIFPFDSLYEKNTFNLTEWRYDSIQK